MAYKVKLLDGFTYELPQRGAPALIARRNATALGAYKQQSAELVLTLEDWDAAAESRRGAS